MEIRLVTCDSLPRGDAELAWLETQLQQHGFGVDIAAWSDDNVDWSDANFTWLRTTWDYTRAVHEFLAWIEEVAKVTVLENPPELVRWNSHKSYLLDLQQKGVRIVPTVLLNAASEAAVVRVLRQRHWRRAVLKPAIGLDGQEVVSVTWDGTSLRRTAGSPPDTTVADFQSPREMLIQPFVDSITEGEYSVVWLEGEPLRLVRKKPASHDFRVQENWGGSVEMLPDDAAFFDLARQVMRRVEGDPFYARIDFVVYDHEACLMELELIEPSLFLDRHPADFARVASLLERRLGRHGLL